MLREHANRLGLGRESADMVWVRMVSAGPVGADPEGGREGGDDGPTGDGETPADSVRERYGQERWEERAEVKCDQVDGTHQGETVGEVFAHQWRDAAARDAHPRERHDGQQEQGCG